MVDERTDAETALRTGPPPGTEILYQRRVDKQTREEKKVPFLVQKKAAITGRDVSTARVSIDQNTSEPYVSVDFNAGGPRLLEVTDVNVAAPRHRLSTSITRRSQAHPVQAGPDHGRPPPTGDRPPSLRRAAAAPVQVLEERTVGPSLGADSIRQGIVAILAPPRGVCSCCSTTGSPGSSRTSRSP
jgi:preprotein translocase subunit SecD